MFRAQSFYQTTIIEILHQSPTFGASLEQKGTPITLEGNADVMFQHSTILSSPVATFQMP